MAAEYPEYETTDPTLACLPGVKLVDADPLHSEIHECLRILRRLEPLLGPLDELVKELPALRPLLDAWKRTNGGTVGMLGMRRAMRNGN